MGGGVGAARVDFGWLAPGTTHLNVRARLGFLATALRRARRYAQAERCLLFVYEALSSPGARKQVNSAF